MQCNAGLTSLYLLCTQCNPHNPMPQTHALECNAICTQQMLLNALRNVANGRLQASRGETTRFVQTMFILFSTKSLERIYPPPFFRFLLLFLLSAKPNPNSSSCDYVSCPCQICAPLKYSDTPEAATLGLSLEGTRYSCSSSTSIASKIL